MNRWELVCPDGKVRRKPITLVRHAWAEAQKSAKKGCKRGCPGGPHKVVMWWISAAVQKAGART